jgi:hypothetical protein
MAAELGHQVRREAQTAPFAVLGIVLDDEARSTEPVLGGELDDRAGDGEDPRRQVEVLDAELGQFAPAKAGLDVSLDQQAHDVVRQAVVDPAVVVRRDDAARPGRDRRGLHSLARMQDDDLIVDGGCEDRVQHDLALHDRRRPDTERILQPGDPSPHVAGQDLGHPQVSEFRQQVAVQHIPIGLPGGGLDDVVREPLVLHVAAQRPPAPSRVAHAACFERRLGTLPCTGGLALGGEGPCGPLAATQIPVHRRVPHAAAPAGSFLEPAHVTTQITCPQSVRSAA